MVVKAARNFIQNYSMNFARNSVILHIPVVDVCNEFDCYLSHVIKQDHNYVKYHFTIMQI